MYIHLHVFTYNWASSISFPGNELFCDKLRKRRIKEYAVYSCNKESVREGLKNMLCTVAIRRV